VGQKVHPRGFRLGVIETWDSIWFAGKKEYSSLMLEDLKVRKYIKQNLYKAGISRIKINRRANQIEINVYSAKPGLVIGRGGREVAALREELVKLTKKQVELNIQEENNPETCAQLVAENIAVQLEKRIAYRRVMKQAVAKALRSGGKGIKVMCGGRLNGAEIARSEWYRKGRVPLQTLRARIDYGFAEAMTVYGKIGVKVWIYKGDALTEKEVAAGEVVKPTVTVMETVS
jgi:small subunit ribosomal protein S3